MRRSILHVGAGIMVALVLFLPARPVSAVVATFQPAKDNTMFSEGGALSNGAGAGIFAGRNNQGPGTGVGNRRRALVMFDLSAIPPTATITNVSLAMYMSRRKSGTENVWLHRLNASWGEAGSVAGGEGGQGIAAQTGDATWTHRFYPGTLWTTPGGDYNAVASAVLGIAAEGFYTYTTAAMISDVQAWVANPANNNGWILIGNEASKTTARRFDSRENGTASHRPMLTVTYVTTVVNGACCLPGETCSLLTAGDCATAGGVYQGDGTTCTPNPCITPTGACCLNNGTCDTLTAAQCSAQGGTYQGDGSACTTGLCPVVLTPFVDALPLPAVATPTSGSPGDVATYDITIEEFTQKLHRDLPPTRLWGYNGLYPGPTIEAFKGRPVTVNWINDLRDSLGVLRTTHLLPVDLCMHGPDMEGATPRTVTHLHGGHVPADADGYPEATFLPGQSASYVYPNNQQAATLWYHDHALGITRLNVMLGMAGLYTLRDSVEAALGLPSGSYEVPLVIQDRTFNPDGSLRYPAAWQDHFFGDKILVNGKVWPYLNVDRGKYRFRLLDGSNSRAYQLTLSNNLPFWVIGSEGGLLPVPVRRDTVTITPGERREVIIDFGSLAPGTEVLLTNSAPAPFPGNPGEGVIPNVMKFIVGAATGYTAPLPAALRPVPPIAEGVAVEHRTFELRKFNDPCAGSMWMINGLGWDDITEQPVLGTTEVWSFANRSGSVHPMHMHLVMFQVLDRQNFVVVADTIQLVGSPTLPDSTDRGWKDTVPVYPNEVVRVIARFEDYTGLFAYHCHILEHEDHEMMRQFEVVAPVAVEPVPGPLEIALGSAYPNPARGETSLAFRLSGRAHARVLIEDMAGRRVASVMDQRLDAGLHRAVWDGRTWDRVRAAPGVYFWRLELDGRTVGARRSVLIP